MGIDRSEAFTSKAQATSTTEEYIIAGVAESGWIANLDRRPDLIYTHFLVSHLPKPEKAISNWADELEADGQLLVEDVESISTVVEPFDRYLRIVSKMLAHHGKELFIGSRLTAHQWDTSVQEVDRTTEVLRGRDRWRGCSP